MIALNYHNKCHVIKTVTNCKKIILIYVYFKVVLIRKIVEKNLRQEKHLWKMSSQQETFPKREQAIILDVVEALTLTDYLRAVGAIVGPKNIFAADQIYNGPFCIFLQSTELVDNLLQNHSALKINNMEVGIDRLVNYNKKDVV